MKEAVQHSDCYKKERFIFMNIGLLIIAVVGGTVGIISTLYLTVSFPAVIIWKFYRKVVRKIPMTK